MENKNIHTQNIDDIRMFAEGIDVNRIMQEIKQQVVRKKHDGFYNTYDLSDLAKINVQEIRDDEEFFQYYMKVIQHSWDINIGTYPIPSKGGILGKPMVWLKKAIWHMLKFYTYRLFSQQKDYNAQVANVLQSLNTQMVAKCDALHDRVKKLEEQIESLKK